MEKNRAPKARLDSFENQFPLDSYRSTVEPGDARTHSVSVDIEFLKRKRGKRTNAGITGDTGAQIEEFAPARSLTNRYANHELRERDARGI